MDTCSRARATINVRYDWVNLRYDIVLVVGGDFQIHRCTRVDVGEGEELLALKLGCFVGRLSIFTDEIYIFLYGLLIILRFKKP